MANHLEPNMPNVRPNACGPIFLVGMRASGKTTLGRALAGALGWAFRDTDAMIRAASGLTVAEIVAQSGWERFRDLEDQALRAAAEVFTVVATGGGVVLRPENRRFLRETGRCVYLATESDVLVKRLQRNPKPAQRPALPSLQSGAPHATELDAVRATLAEREPLYREAAHAVLDASQSQAALLEQLKTLAVRNSGTDLATP